MKPLWIYDDVPKIRDSKEFQEVRFKNHNYTKGEKVAVYIDDIYSGVAVIKNIERCTHNEDCDLFTCKWIQEPEQMTINL